MTVLQTILQNFDEKNDHILEHVLVVVNSGEVTIARDAFDRIALATNSMEDLYKFVNANS